MTATRYRGRFAPSPTGNLHFGSLVAAVGSFLDAKSHNGEWLVRIEDLDRTREVPGSASVILKSLEAFGLQWDGEVIYQSLRTDSYAEAIEHLVTSGFAYPCGCSRKEIRDLAVMGREGPIYSGLCRSAPSRRGPSNSIRLRTQDHSLTIHDRVQGSYTQNPGKEIGDFVIRRSDGFHAYQLAVVVDDAWQQITHVVRGADLLSSTPRQCYLQGLLGYQAPDYLHLPVALDHSGRKLSKQQQDRPVDPRRPMAPLLRALEYLRQPLPPDLPENPQSLWQWSIPHWRPSAIPSKPKMRVAP
jgi:glutamyl-Q tRNA(Asp) synthetase